MGRLDFAHHKWCDVIKADQIFQRYFVQQLLATVSEYLQLFFFCDFSSDLQNRNMVIYEWNLFRVK